MFLVVVLGGAFGLAKACTARDVKLDKDEAIEIASTRIDFAADLTQARYLNQGVRGGGSWFVSFATQDANGDLLRCVVVEVDAKVGTIGEVRAGGARDC